MEDYMDKDWTMDLEHDEYEDDIDYIINDALKAVEDTAPGRFVNLVTASVFGNPKQYLEPLLLQLYSTRIRVKYIDQCGCGGYVLRVWKLQ
jgi:putative CGCGG family rSAM target protein